MKLSEELKNGQTGIKNKGFGKQVRSSGNSTDDSLNENSLAPIVEGLQGALNTQVQSLMEVAQGFDQNKEKAAEAVSDWLVDAMTGKSFAEAVVQKTSEKLVAPKPVEFSSVATFQPPKSSDGKAFRDFYEKTSFLRGTTPKQLGQG